jgi:hypothetical protein
VSREELGLTVAFARELVAGELSPPEDNKSTTRRAADMEDDGVAG